MIRILLSLILCLSAFQALADLEAGVDAVSRRDYDKAFQEFKPLAEEGDIAAQVNLGNLYMMGLGVQQSDEDAFHWYQRAAEQGERIAQTKLGIHYYHGLGVPQDVQEAGRWFLMAAQKGEPGAESILGSMYALGDGFSKDYVQAYYWYSLAKQQGSQSAQEGLESLAEDMTLEQKDQALKLLNKPKAVPVSDAPHPAHKARSHRKKHKR